MFKLLTIFVFSAAMIFENTSTETARYGEVELSQEIINCLIQLKQVRDQMTMCLDKITGKQRPQYQSTDPPFQECHEMILPPNSTLEAKVEKCQDTVQSPTNTPAQNFRVQQIFQSWGRL